MLGEGEGVIQAGVLMNEEEWKKATELIKEGDKKEALWILKKLAQKGEVAAYKNIGKIYENGGGGVPQDFNKAFYWFKKAVEIADDRYGYTSLGRMYYFGRGVERDIGKAFWYYREASNSGSPEASHFLATMYRLGEYVGKSYLKARWYYFKSLREGNLFSYLGLASMEREEGNRLRSYCYRGVAFFSGLRLFIKDPKSKRLKTMEE